MFKSIRNKSLLAFVVATTLVAHAYGAETAGQYLDDATIATKTKAALVDSSKVSAADINVDVYKGSVQLSGFVDSQTEEAAVLAAAGKVEGAVKVVDAIVVLPGSRSMGEVVDDTTIQAKLKTGLANVEGFSNAVAINTAVQQGHVLLAGFVDSDKLKTAAGEVARNIAGVKEVHNLITVAH